MGTSINVFRNKVIKFSEIISKDFGDQKNNEHVRQGDIRML